MRVLVAAVHVMPGGVPRVPDHRQTRIANKMHGDMRNLFFFEGTFFFFFVVQLLLLLCFHFLKSVSGLGWVLITQTRHKAEGLTGRAAAVIRYDLLHWPFP